MREEKERGRKRIREREKKREREKEEEVEKKRKKEGKREGIRRKSVIPKTRETKAEKIIMCGKELENIYSQTVLRRTKKRWKVKRERRKKGQKRVQIGKYSKNASYEKQ